MKTENGKARYEAGDWVVLYQTRATGKPALVRYHERGFVYMQLVGESDWHEWPEDWVRPSTVREAAEWAIRHGGPNLIEKLLKKAA